MVKDLRYRPRAASIGDLTPSGAPRRSSLRDALLELLESAEQVELGELEAIEAAGIYTGISLNPRKQRYLELCYKAWDALLLRLSKGECIGTGCAPGDPFADHQAIPARRWAYAKPDFERWTVNIANVDLTEIEVSTVGGLHISKRFSRVRLGATTFKVGKYLPLLVSLAQGAKSGRPVEPLDELSQLHFSGNKDQKALGQGIFQIKHQMARAGIDEQTIELLIENVPGTGYRLNMPPAEITIED